MADPIAFPSTTPNYSLPLLFTGQAQKEFSLNQSLTLIDALLTPSVNASTDTPPPTANEGESFRVSAPATGDWTNHEDEIAIRIGGAWQFVQPVTGMTLYDQADAAYWHYNSTWKSAAEPAAPTGGSVVDIEARTALAELIQALRNLGIFAGQS
ncbi:MAG: hypothetical protein CL955_07615 [Erythrobacteraceae bacterium]|nr:hypothetical protein [Erythrobacteraceae bacterium]|tara:strand:- start:48 stop:509 length:462 start_codon:yes stop_codon:yes gene_type:complete